MTLRPTASAAGLRRRAVARPVEVAAHAERRPRHGRALRVG
jgi:hypothetical protein